MRGQTALEYLVTYGWAILALVVIAGVLWYMGVFNPSRFVSDKQCSGFSGAFLCQDFSMGSTGTLTIVLNNIAGGTISITSSGCSPASVAANANTTCTLSGFPAGSVGNRFNQQTVNINYTDTRSGIAHSTRGFVAGTYE